MKFKTVLFPLLQIAFVFTVISDSYSHPHVFIINRITIVFDEQGLAGIRVGWRFDEFFSSMIVSDYDENKNGVFEKSEIIKIENAAFRNLSEFNYFTFIKINGQPFKVKYVREFNASLDKGFLIYEFFIPCHVKTAPYFKKFTISQYDPTYYTAIFYAENNPVGQEAGSKFETIYHDIAENKNESYYFGMIYPVELTMEFRSKNG